MFRPRISEALHMLAGPGVEQDVIDGLMPTEELFQLLGCREVAAKVELDINVWRELAGPRQNDDVVAIRGGGAQLALRFEEAPVVTQQPGNFRTKVLPKRVCRRGHTYFFPSGIL